MPSSEIRGTHIFRISSLHLPLAGATTGASCEQIKPMSSRPRAVSARGSLNIQPRSATFALVSIRLNRSAAGVSVSLSGDPLARPLGTRAARPMLSAPSLPLSAKGVEPASAPLGICQRKTFVDNGRVRLQTRDPQQFV